MQLRRREEGIALIAAIMTMLVVAGLMTFMFARTVNEAKTTQDSAAITRTLLLARAGANFGVAMLNEPIRQYLNTVVADTSSSSSRWAYDRAAGATTAAPNPRNVAAELQNFVSSGVQPLADAYACNFGGYGSMQGRVSVRVYFTNTACGVALPSSVSLPAGRFHSGEGRNSFSIGKQAYAVPFVLVSEGTEGEYRRNVVIQGEYVFDIGRSSFARFAYFTNVETAADGSAIFFNDKTLIDGPVHTNGNFAYAYDPWFGGEVTSSGCRNPDSRGRQCGGTYDGGAIFRETYCSASRNGECTAYRTRNTFVKDENMQPNDQAPTLGGTTPTFADGVAWNANYIPLPQNSSDQQRIAQGLNPDGSQRQDVGINHTGNLYSLEFRTVDAAGRAPTLQNGTWTPPATYQVIKTCTSSAACTVYAVDQNKRMATCSVTPTRTEEACFSSFNNWTPASKPFNGVIHVSGTVDRMKGPTRTAAADARTAAPAVAAFSQLTVAATGQIRLTGDLKYEDRPVTGQPIRNNDRTVTPPEFTNPDAVNILGVYSSGGDVVVGNENSGTDLNAPRDVEVESVLMSGLGSISVENYESGTGKGSFKLLGGMIQNRRGAFGIFSGSGGATSGYDRVYTYDRRLKEGLAPPFFPTTGQDQVNFVRVTAYGQREQVQ